MLARLIFLIFVIQVAGCEDAPVKRCARAAQACQLAAETTEGPYYWNSTVRQDITEGKPGVPFSLAITVLDTNACTPISNALVDIWHCDSAGIYSHYVASSLNQWGASTDNTTFFRGQQVTNSNGVATFKTVYPGWYRGRATHIHIKVHIGASVRNVGGAVVATGGHVSHTGQMFFDDALTDRVATVSPYSTRSVRRTRNSEDGIFEEANGTNMIIPIRFTGSNFSAGMTGAITVGVDPTATPGPAGFGGGGRPPNGQRPSGPPPNGSRSTRRTTTPRSV